jgi:TMEM175 potassium channel family protein
MTPDITPTLPANHPQARASAQDPPVATPSAGLSTVRVAGLTDGVFAIVLTLLVLDLHAPSANSQTQLLSSLRAIGPQLILFVVSFAIVAVFWYGHHMELHWVVRSDRVHLGITLAFLLMISFVPFSASLLGKNHQLPIAATIYGSNLCLAGVIRYAHWVYATNHCRLVAPTLDADVINYVRRVFIIVPILYVVASAVAWLSTNAAIVGFVLIPLLYVKPARNTRHLTSLQPRQPSSR